jgi:hypothetical protein
MESVTGESVSPPVRFRALRVVASVPLVLVGLPFILSLLLAVVGLVLVTIDVNFVRMALGHIVGQYSWVLELITYVAGFGLSAIGLHHMASGARRPALRKAKAAEFQAKHG